MAAAGEAMTGVLVARAIDPPGSVAGAHGELCLNCGTRLIGTHCHACGQARHVHRTVGAIGHEIAHGVFHFEGKIWRTLPMLAWRPGELTRRYIAGERARFVSPLALFLFSVFLMFAVFSAIGSTNANDATRGFYDGFTEVDIKLEQQADASRKQIAELERARATLVSQRQPTAAIDGQLEEARTALRINGKMRRGATAEKGTPPTGQSWIDKAIAKIRDDPALVAYKVQSSAYKYSWALILLSTPFVALLFVWRRGYGLYDHAIFVTYSIAFMSLLVIVLEIALTFNLARPVFWAIVLLAPPAHMFVQLRGAYRLSILSAAWRTVFLLLFAVVVLLSFVLALVAMGVSG